MRTVFSPFLCLYGLKYFRKFYFFAFFFSLKQADTLDESRRQFLASNWMNYRSPTVNWKRLTRVVCATCLI